MNPVSPNRRQALSPRGEGDSITGSKPSLISASCL